MSVCVNVPIPRWRMSILRRVAVLYRITGPLCGVTQRESAQSAGAVQRLLLEQDCADCPCGLVLGRGHQFAQMIHHPDPGETNYIVDISRCAPLAARPWHHSPQHSPQPCVYVPYTWLS